MTWDRLIEMSQIALDCIKIKFYMINLEKLMGFLGHALVPKILYRVKLSTIASFSCLWVAFVDHHHLSPASNWVYIRSLL